MPVNTITVATAVTPTVIETAILHYLKRGPLRQKPTAHISYHEGLELIRKFLYYASFHTVEELQAFTSQWVPVPHWVHVEEVDIPSSQLAKSADLIQTQLGPEGMSQVGGKTWWQWRLDNAALKAEWIEMRKDYEERLKAGAQKSHRIMLYVHGGAYFFGSVDEHRYQMQRHARKLKARVLAPRYRLAPQFPFPCGLQDCEFHTGRLRLYTHMQC
jgi:acetyl esterase/lipase